MKKVKLILFFILILALVFLGYFLNSASKTKAQTIAPTSVTGYANFLNLEQGGTASPAIFFTGNNGGSTGNISYAVQYNTSTGLTGYGWSPIYGWINFTGNTASVPSFQNDGEATEWANGQISLSGSNGGSTGNMTYSVNFDPTSGQGSGYAWGGNVLGWIDFSHVIVPISTDLCTNITGVQLSVPNGMTQVNGECVEDLCPNDSGIQTALPCPNGDYCPNIPGVQTSIPSGMHIVNNNCVNISIDLCPDIPGDQTSLPCVPIITFCTDSQLNDYTTDPTTQISTPVSWPCYCSAHPTSTNPDCVTFCLNNPSSCKKAPHYQEN